jgi:quercetin dioxygenase-like cupin family protein
VTARVVELPPGGQTGWHAHRAPVYAYVIEGMLEVEGEDGAVRIYRTGEAFAELVGTRHNGRARGDRPVRLVAFYTGEQGITTTTRLD